MGTSSTYYYGTSTASDSYIKADNKFSNFYINNSYEDFDEAPSKPKNDFNTKLIKNFSNIINELHLEAMDLAISIFTKHKSDVEKDVNKLIQKVPCYTHIVHPIKSDPQYDPVNFFSYNLAIVSDILEYMPSTMARANIIKEALTSLKYDKKSYLIIKTKSKEDAEKLQEVVLSEDDLISLALYAGAVKTWKLECMKEVKFPLIIASNKG